MLHREEVENFMARAVLEQPGLAFAFIRSQLERGRMPSNRAATLVQRSWHRQFAIDLVVVQKPFYYFQTKSNSPQAVCSHGTPYSYDTNVPRMIQGSKSIKLARYG